jgi:LacI family transcriptional regulator, gluconate utilization system Gnt-I transcriptional repressor
MIAITSSHEIWGHVLKKVQKKAAPAMSGARGDEGQPPTMADVARHAGVSAMTVSRALRKGSQVSEPTRKKILNSVNDLGYVLDQAAGSLSSRKTGFIAALVPSINNSNFADTARGITDQLEDAGLQLLLGYTDYDEEKEERLIETMLRRRPEGIILTGGMHTGKARRMLRSAGIPVVETWDVPAEPIDQVVGFSNEEAMRLLIKTMAARGYRKFGYIGGTTMRDSRGEQRRAGFVRAIEELSLPPGRIVSFGIPPISIEQGGQAIVALLERWPGTELVACVSDLSAFGALMECKRRGLAVPEDIAITGFGDYEVGAYSQPRITTVNVDCYGIGRQAATRITDLIHRPLVGRHDEIILTSFRVVEREST